MNKKELFADFLNSYLNHISDDHGNYYARFDSDGTVTIVDSDDRLCNNPSIYQLLELRSEEYGYRMTKQLTFIET